MMRKLLVTVLFFGMAIIPFINPGTANSGEARTKPTDILSAHLSPGTVVISTIGDIFMSFGAQARIIPTYESNYDLGLGDEVPNFLGGKYNNDFFKVHPNESGFVSEGYIRSEDRLYFAAMPSDKSWSFYAALEFDRPLDTSSVDDRGGARGTTSNSGFGLERLHGSIALPFNLRFHAGWDIQDVDVIHGAGLSGLTICRVFG